MQETKLVLILPFAELEKDTLQALLEDIVTRDGTDYGAQEISTVQKIEQVKNGLQRGRVCLCYDPETQTCNIVPAEEARRWVVD